ncbi:MULTISPECIES: ABC transporter permease [unclassified Micromonospora]|uniref:ABC transporter permease n=1 Tax=unclassified Micromonospora TaxID=2617518 RepID=UPI00098D4ABD|nr:MULTISPECIES: ABC transporter permease [unclassified Micromonospora]MDI5936964.1 ABC transporter permease [Micromonospora sp. DH15]OON30174.1 ABC transporter permease [Micromonospora sp. Rc5]
MTAPTINGTRYPQPVDELLPAARKLAHELDALPSRNRLMKRFRIGSEKANELLTRLREERAQQDRVDSLHAAMVLRGSLAERPVLVPVDPTPDTTTADTDPDTPDRPEQPAPDPTPAPPPVDVTPVEQVSTVESPGTKIRPARSRRAVVWPVILLALPAFVAIWGGWVGLGKLTGFGKVNLLPGIGSGWVIDTAITLPIGVETYGAFALYVWLSGRVPARAARFAKWSALGSLAIGALGQVAYHLLIAAGVTSAPWWITTLVACLPVAVLGMGAALAHLMHADD